MNIHISLDEFNRLKETIITQVTVGSHLYKMNNASSDKDILYICGSFEDNLHSLVQMHHQFQYKEEGIDHLFVDLQTFTNNLLKGDSTINFEAIYSDEIRNNSDLSFLYDSRFMFYNYNLIRSYLGLARRDIKEYKKTKDNKKLFHAIRGKYNAQTLLNKEEYSNDFSSKIEYSKLLLDIKNHTWKEEALFVETLVSQIDSLRDTLNKKLDSKEIEKIISAKDLMNLDKSIKAVSKKYLQAGSFVSEEYYSTYQEDVKY